MIIEEEGRRTVKKEADRILKDMKPGKEFGRIDFVQMIKDFKPGTVRCGVDHWLVYNLAKGKIIKIDKGKYKKV